jgi:hypothetical protein
MDINRICKIESLQKNFIEEKSVILGKFRKKRQNRIMYDEEILVARFNSRSKE